MRLPSTSPHPALSAWATALLSLWLMALWAGPLLLTALEATTGIALNPHGHSHLYAHGHPFVDARTLLGLPNAMDVLSNAPIAVAGLWGLLALRRSHWSGATRQAAQVFFVGLLLTGFGSAWYHRAPDAEGLVWDRLGMAVTFAGALALAVAGRVGEQPARHALWTALPLAVLSAMLPAANGNVLPWAVVQFGGMALIAWLALHQPVVGAAGIRLGALIGLYALAKGLELGDEAVFHATAETVSGHSLKHLAAACAAWPVIAALSPRGSKAPARLRQNAAGRAA
ncbi:hypothetical protein [Hydrogenophaga sp. MI9]|uniref:hypothetical protein n=1 Tax=Hydrogenophaga sp. MI9 TaxID=3453719 RepID=UPI003EEE6114